MSSRLTAAAVSLLLLIGQPGFAQYAFNSHGPAAPREVEESPSLAYKMVHGVVQGQQGALPGATVWLRGTATIAVTNAEGEFELRVPANAKTLELKCSYGGLLDEVVRLAAVQALGSVYLLRPNSSTGK